MTASPHTVIAKLLPRLRRFSGLPYKEAAKLLDLPVGTLTGRLARVRGALQGMLSDQARTVS